MNAAIELCGVEKHYRVGDETVAALRGIDLALPAGRFAAIQGPSGSGKSTLLNLCGLLDRGDAGSITLAGEATDGLGEAARAMIRRQRVGFIFQAYNLVPVMTVAENVDYPLGLLGVARGERRRRVAEMLAAVGLDTLAGRFPESLSGGQRQRVAIARALVKSPALVIADEPTANLDSDTARQVIELMRHLGARQGSTFLIATHDPRMAAGCDAVYALADGVLQ